MSLIYGVVARGTDVLAEYSPDTYQGNFIRITQVLLSQIKPGDGKRSYVSDKDKQSFCFHYDVVDAITYLCMSSADYSRMPAFRFLEEVRKEFQATYGERAQSFKAYQVNADFKHTIKAQMDRFNGSGLNKIKAVQDQLADIKTVMTDNIDKILEREEVIVSLMDKSEELTNSAEQFRVKSRKLNRVMWWKNCRIWFVLIFIVLLIIFVIVVSACGGFTFPNC